MHIETTTLNEVAPGVSVKGLMSGKYFDNAQVYQLILNSVLCP